MLGVGILGFCMFEGPGSLEAVMVSGALGFDLKLLRRFGCGFRAQKGVEDESSAPNGTASKRTGLSWFGHFTALKR